MLLFCPLYYLHLTFSFPFVISGAVFFAFVEAKALHSILFFPMSLSFSGENLTVLAVHTLCPLLMQSTVISYTGEDRKRDNVEDNAVSEWPNGRRQSGRGRQMWSARRGRWEYICGGQCCETRQVAVTLKMTVIKVSVGRWIWWFWLANQSSVKRTTAQIHWPRDTPLIDVCAR